MANYYEQLNLAPEATAADIEAAIDKLYNQWRQAVNHPDPAVVEDANRNMRVLEQMRSTLTDYDKRAAYDAGLGLGGVGGLSDPSAIFAPPPPPPPKRSDNSSSDESDSLWACPKCNTQNPEWTQFCLKCQTELVRRCPECGKLKSLVKTGVCGSCGLSYTNASQRVALQSEIGVLTESTKLVEADIHELKSIRLPPVLPAQEKWLTVIGALFVIFFLVLGLAVLVLDGFSNAGPPFAFALLIAGLFAIGRRVVRRQRVEILNEQATINSELQEKQAQLDSLYQQLDEAKAAREKLGKRRVD